MDYFFWHFSISAHFVCVGEETRLFNADRPSWFFQTFGDTETKGQAKNFFRLLSLEDFGLTPEGDTPTFFAPGAMQFGQWVRATIVNGPDFHLFKTWLTFNCSLWFHFLNIYFCFFFRTIFLVCNLLLRNGPCLCCSWQSSHKPFFPSSLHHCWYGMFLGSAQFCDRVYWLETFFEELTGLSPRAKYRQS